MFELTDTLTYAVPIMLAVLVAKTVADALEPKGIYDLVIDLSQLPFLDTKTEYLWGHLQINDVVSTPVVCYQYIGLSGARPNEKWKPSRLTKTTPSTS